MKRFIKGAALALATVMALTSAQLVVMADDENLPSAVVTELTGADLNANDVNAILADFSINAEELTGLTETEYTMNKAVVFSTNYPNTNEGNELKKDDLKNYGDWICDFRINIDTPDNAIKGDEIILIGNYGGWGNIGFVTSKLAEMAGVSEVQDGDYYLMQVMAAAMGKPNMANETYREVAEGVINFKCGIVDNDLPMESKVTVQLVMYEDRERTIVHEIGDPVIYYKHADTAEEFIPVGDIDSTVKEVAAEGVEKLTVEGIKDAMKATEKTKVINDYIVDNSIEADEGTTTVNVDIFAKTEEVAETADMYQLTPYAKITCQGYNDKEVKIENDQLKENEKIKVVIPVSEQPLYILHCTNGGALIDKYMPGDPDDGKYFSYDSDAGTCTLYVSHFSTLQAITKHVVISDIDAYIDNNGTGNLRFITSCNDPDAPTEFGTWVVPADYFGTDFDQKAIYSATQNVSSLINGATFTTDIMEIPSDMLGKIFYAKSFVEISGTSVFSEVVEATVDQYKNYTSAVVE